MSQLAPTVSIIIITFQWAAVAPKSIIWLREPAVACERPVNLITCQFRVRAHETAIQFGQSIQRISNANHYRDWIDFRISEFTVKLSFCLTQLSVLRRLTTQAFTWVSVGGQSWLLGLLVTFQACTCRRGWQLTLLTKDTHLKNSFEQ